MKKVTVPKEYTYIATFLTMQCNLNCPYCINAYDKNKFKRNSYWEMPTENWIEGLNRLKIKGGLPITLQGGEPTLHSGFYDIINGIKKKINVDILTNLQFNIKEFIDKIDPKRLNRKDSIYKPIRVSYHPLKMDIEKTIKDIKRLEKAGFDIGLFSVNHPSQTREIRIAHKRCLEEGVYYWVKDFLGYCNGELFGNFHPREAILRKYKKGVTCRTKELIISPSGTIYKCHADLYNNENHMNHLLNPKLKLKHIYRSCNKFGFCNPCDVKIKTNRFLGGGFVPVEIRGVDKNDK